MSRNTWEVQTKESGDAWASTDTIYRPNDSMTLRKLSTQTKIKLVNGSDAFVTPATKYYDDQILFVWYEDESGVLKAQIEEYIEDQTDLKIIDHLATEYIGRFISLDSIWKVGYETATYDIKAVFEIMPNL